MCRKRFFEDATYIWANFEFLRTGFFTKSQAKKYQRCQEVKNVENFVVNKSIGRHGLCISWVKQELLIVFSFM